MPQWTAATVADDKILGYLLSAMHLRGKDKARLFGALGYTSDNWLQLRADVLAVARGGEEAAVSPTSHGTKYVVDGVVVSPIGRPVNLRTVWIVDVNSEVPRLVTAYPR